jgi:hypothetical protein
MARLAGKTADMTRAALTVDGGATAQCAMKEATSTSGKDFV